MCKSCDNCYWRLGGKDPYCYFKVEVPEDKVCSCHDYTCDFLNLLS